MSLTDRCHYRSNLVLTVLRFHLFITGHCLTYGRAAQVVTMDHNFRLEKSAVAMNDHQLEMTSMYCQVVGCTETKWMLTHAVIWGRCHGERKSFSQFQFPHRS